jgi:hypothetical protein
LALGWAVGSIVRKIAVIANHAGGRETDLSNRQVQTSQPTTRWLPLMLGVLFLCLSFVSQTTLAACPETVGTTSPIVYQDCVEFIDIDPGTNPDTYVATTSTATQIGDYQVLVVIRKSGANTAAITTPSGWTEIMASTRNGADSNNDVVMGIYAKSATAAGSENVSVTTAVGGGGNTSNDLLITILRFSNTLGHDTAAGANATNAPAANATVTSLGITTTMVNSMVLRVAGIDDDDQTNATDTTPLFGDTTVSLQETAASNNSATGIVTRDLQAAIGATGNATFANGASEEWITRTFALRPQNYFSLTVPASGQVCELHVVSIVARNVDGTINTTYTGTITLSTSTALGDWSKTGGDANGDVTNGTVNDGSATYNFTLADAGTIDLVYTSATVGSVNFNIVDGSGFRELKTVANDSNLTLSACVPTFLSIAHAGSGGMCGATAVTVSGVTAGLVLDPNYQGSIQISAGGSGNWSVAPGSPGTFDNGTADDGIATYDFVAGDGGDIVLFFTPAGAGTVNFNVVDPAKPLLLVHPTRDPDLTVENCEYRISHDSSGNNCSIESVTFAIVTASGATVSNYVGTLNLTVTSAATDKGTWSLQGGDTGTLNETTIKDGIATYTFPASNSGSVTLNFATGDTGSFNFNVTGNSYLTNSSYDPVLTVAACKFRVVYTGGNSTDVCSYKEVTISAVDDNNVAVTNFVGQVSITTTSSKGTWQESGSQPGTLSDLLANDGAATYTFVAGDNGDVALILNVAEAGIGTLKVDVETAGGAIKVDTNPTYDPDLSISLCSYRIAVTDGQLSTCSIELVTLSVYNSSAALAVDYVGTVDLQTLNGNGSWVLNTGTGTLQDPVAEDGEASYTFSAADDGVVVLRFLDETAEDTNIDATDRLEDGFEESSSYDPALTVTPCIPTNFSTLCYNFNEALINNAISIPAEIVGLESRMVLMYAFTPSGTAPTAPTLYQGATPYAMTEIRTVTAGNALLTVWGILGTALPDTATTFNFNMGGSWSGPRDPGVCLVSLENVAQALPVATTPLQDGPLNSFVGNATGSSALGLTSTQNNSVAISAIGTATDAATTIASSLGNTLWDLNSGDATAPDSSNFNGHYDIQPTAAAFTVTETTGTINDVAHIALLLAPRVAGAPFATDYVPVALFDTLAGNIGYRAIGNSLRALPNPTVAPFTNACVMNASSAAVLDLPTGSTIKVAYLYWGASGGSETVLDTVVKFGATVADLQTLQDVSAEETFEIMGVGQNGNLDYFVGYQDVTSLISTATSQSYSFTNLTAQTGTPWVTTSACVAGWGLVVVFENVTAEPFVNVINLFHGFQPFQNSSVTLLPGNFRMAEANALTNVPRGLITHITFEGDNTLNTGNEVFELQNNPAALTFEALTNPYNLGTAQYNDTVSFPNYSQIGLTSPVPYILQSGTSYGTDIDTYYIAGAVASAADSKEDILYPFAQVPTAEQIATRFSAGQDLVLLTGEFISVTNAPIADLEIVASTSGTMKVATTAAGSVYFDIENNGNNAPSNGYATGTVILSAVMPSGLTINAVDPADAHWSCSNTTTAFRCTFDIESWTGGTLDGAIYRLDDGASLPQVEVVVTTGDDTFFPLQSNTAYVSGRISHFDTPTGCSFVGIPDGEQPDPATCTKAEQFDNVNNLANNTIDIDSLSTKQVDNNNVDRATLTIAGVLTNLQMDISVIGVLQQGQSGQYQLTVTNNGPDATSKVMTVTATFDANAAPADGNFSVTGWSCSVASAALTCTSTAAIANGGSSSILVDIPDINKAEGQFVLVSAAVAAGTYNFDTDLSNNTDTLSTEVVGTIVPITEKFLLSVTEAATLGANTLGLDADDLVLFDPSNDEAELFRDMGTIGGVTDIDAVHLLSNGWIVFSADGTGTFLTVAYADEDLLIYDPILNSAVMLFDGSDANKFAAGAAAANIDALHVDTNGSWTTSSWELYLSTTDTASLPGASNFEDKDVVLYDMAANTASLFFDGSDANKFGTAAGDIDGFFIPYDDADLYYLTVSDAVASIDPPTSESFERDDLVSWDNAEANGDRAQQVFDGEQSDGFIPLPISATLGIDALHVVQEGYFGHFAISTVDGDTCNAGSVTIRKHAALGHTVETTYRGSVRITESTGTGTWVADTTAKGTLVNLGSGVARYTFHPDDLGVVTLLLGNTNVSTNVDIDVTNGIAEEALAEDATIDIALSLLAVEYLDNLNLVSYGNNSGDTAWSSDWTEVNDDSSSSTGDIFITGGRLRMKDSNADMPWVQRTVDFSYEAASDIVLTFKWNRTSGSPSDYFSVDYNLNSSGWTSLDQFGDASTGVVNQTSESINLTTAASITGEDGDSLQIRFRVASGMLLPYVEIDDIKISTSTGSDCNPGVPLDHYHVSHGGSMVSCVAENITITAHDSSHNAVNPGAGVVLELATFNAGGYWNQPLSGNGSLLPLTPASTGVATYTYPAGESAVTIPFNFTNIYPPTDSVQVNFSAASTVGAVEPDYVAPALTVNRAGLRFYNFTDSSTTMPSLMAGADSFAYSSKQLIVQLVQASPVNPAQCEPLVDVGEEASIQLVLECSDPGTCAAADVQASITHKDGTGTATSAINTLDDNGTTWIGNVAEFGTALTFEFEDFGGNPGAWFRLNYPDVGDVQLHGRYRVPLNNDATAAAGLSADYLQGSASTNFRVRPFGLDVDFSDDRRTSTDDSLASTGAASDVFGVAGVAETVTVSAVIYQAADDANGDWQPDPTADLSDNAIARNFGNESWFDYKVKLNLMTDDPATGAEDPVVGSPQAAVPGGVVGILSQTGAADDFTAGRSNFDLTYNEVGIIDIHAQLLNPNDSVASYGNSGGGFTGQVQGGILNVGRFVPFGFDLKLPGDSANTRVVERPDNGGAADFTYMGEEFEVYLALQAKQANGVDLTQNYRGDYANLDNLTDGSAMFSFKAFEDIAAQADVNYTTRLGTLTDLAYPTAWQGGEAVLRGRLVFNRLASNVPDGPFTLSVGVDLADSDGVTDLADRRIDSGGADDTAANTLAYVDANTFRYGRLVLLNAYGSELPNEGGLNEGKDLGMGVMAEYWDTATSQFVVNVDDDGSIIGSDALAEIEVLEGDPANDLNVLADGDTEALLDTSVADITLVAGETRQTGTQDVPFWFTAPGEGYEGRVLMELDLDTALLGFLKYDWRDDGQTEDIKADPLVFGTQDNPRAVIEFGVYRGNSRIINWQELFIND